MRLESTKYEMWLLVSKWNGLAMSVIFGYLANTISSSPSSLSLYLSLHFLVNEKKIVIFSREKMKNKITFGFIFDRKIHFSCSSIPRDYSLRRRLKWARKRKSKTIRNRNKTRIRLKKSNFLVITKKHFHVYFRRRNCRAKFIFFYLRAKTRYKQSTTFDTTTRRRIDFYSTWMRIRQILLRNVGVYTFRRKRKVSLVLESVENNDDGNHQSRLGITRWIVDIFARRKNTRPMEMFE